MHPAPRLLAVLGVAALAPALAGCRALCFVMCPTPVTEQRESRTLRDSPLATIDYLIDAMRRRAPNDIYATLHPDFVARMGGFSAFDFANAYTYYESDFQADSRRLAAARKRLVGYNPEDGRQVRIDIEDGTMSVKLVLVNRPAARVVVDDMPDISGPVTDLASILEVQDDGLHLTGAVPLGSKNDFVDPAAVRRVEIYQDWLIYSIYEPVGIRFVDEVMKQAKGARR